jgi:hypothetical protein
MTSSRPSDPDKTVVLDSEGKPLPSRLADEVCESCGGPMRLRNAKPFPVVLQALFGISFIAFLFVQGSGRLPTRILWGWSILQIGLGVLLVRARYASGKKVFICLRCGATLR